MIELPDYLVEATARQVYTEQYPPSSFPLWEDAESIIQEGCKEIARVRLQAKAAQTDIPR